MRRLLTFLVIISFSTACTKKNTGDCPAHYSYAFEANKRIYDTVIMNGTDTVNLTEEATGNNLLFRYRYTKGGCQATLGDDDQSLVFQINPSLRGFEYIDSSLLTIVAYYIDPGQAIHKSQKISKGFIKGSKINPSNWDITVQIFPEQGSSLSFTKIFTLLQ